MMTKTLVNSVLIAALAATSLATAASAFGGLGFGPGGNNPPFDFAAVDKDGDGKITRAEMDAFQKARAAEADANKDGFVAPEELKAHMIAQFTARADDLVKRMIDGRDDDGDGKLSLAEMQAGPGPARMMQFLDQDGDGALTQAELTAARDQMVERRHGRGHGHFGGFDGGPMMGPMASAPLP